MPYHKGPGVKKSGPKGPSKVKGSVLDALLEEFDSHPSDPSHIIADRGERLRMLDMELWGERFTGTASTAKDLMYWPDFDEFQMRGPGWGAVLPEKSLITTKGIDDYYYETYKRTKEGKRVPSKPPEHKKNSKK